ncbi:MAG TPA: AmmeMemoRadiSam system protein B [Candidatus Binatia bacterium]|nr:AmmeMemoRadiSam system protein B [Candidatus Binatia bacterium]
MALKKSSLAGSWYPEDEETLRRLVDGLLDAAPESPGPWIGAIVPHAGYQYSGATAAAAYRQFRGRALRRAVILAPSHTADYRGVAVLDAEGFLTPLGRVAIDRAAAELSDDRLLRVDAAPFRGEHSLEIQLPFLQRVLPGLSVVPLLAGRLEEGDYARVGILLDRLASDETIFLISSDFTHFGRRFGYVPFLPADASDARRRLRALDMGAIEPALRCDPAGFREHLARTGDTVCGHVPIEAFLAWARGRLRGTLLDYRTSLDVTGDYDHTVSYAAIAFGSAA